MSSKKGELYKNILKQGLIYKSDVDELSKSLMDLFEEEISKKQDQLNELSLKKELLKKGISPSNED